MYTKALMLLLLFTAFRWEAKGQLYYTKNGNISFFSKTILENIDASNNQVISVINFQTGSIQFSLLNNAFNFPKAKMQEDFNENYIESDKYPRSAFKGTISDISNVDISKDGSYKVNVKGSLTIHGVTKNISVPATILIREGNLSATSVFHILVRDYNISVPSIMSNKIGESIEVRVNCRYEKK
jgi:hypothetical protein